MYNKKAKQDITTIKQGPWIGLQHKTSAILATGCVLAKNPIS